MKIYLVCLYIEQSGILPMKTSCGAIFYTYNENKQLGIILGDEGHDCESWLPFKGCVEENESLINTAIREVAEETCGLVNLTPMDLKLEHIFTTKRKTYYIGLCYAKYSIIEEFDKKRQSETRTAYTEKKKLKFFLLDEVLTADNVHSISRSSIEYYWNSLILMKAIADSCTTGETINLAKCFGEMKTEERSRCLGMTEDQLITLDEKRKSRMMSTTTEKSCESKPIGIYCIPKDRCVEPATSSEEDSPTYPTYKPKKYNIGFGCRANSKVWRKTSTAE